MFENASFAARLIPTVCLLKEGRSEIQFSLSPLLVLSPVSIPSSLMADSAEK